MSILLVFVGWRSSDLRELLVRSVLDMFSSGILLLDEDTLQRRGRSTVRDERGCRGVVVGEVVVYVFCIRWICHCSAWVPFRRPCGYTEDGLPKTLVGCSISLGSYLPDSLLRCGEELFGIADMPVDILFAIVY